MVRAGGSLFHRVAVLGKRLSEWDSKGMVMINPCITCMACPSCKGQADRTKKCSSLEHLLDTDS